MNFIINNVLQFNKGVAKILPNEHLQALNQKDILHEKSEIHYDEPRLMNNMKCNECKECEAMTQQLSSLSKQLKEFVTFKNSEIAHLNGIIEFKNNYIKELNQNIKKIIQSFTNQNYQSQFAQFNTLLLQEMKEITKLKVQNDRMRQKLKSLLIDLTFIQSPPILTDHSSELIDKLTTFIKKNAEEDSKYRHHYEQSLKQIQKLRQQNIGLNISIQTLVKRQFQLKSTIYESAVNLKKQINIIPLSQVQHKQVMQNWERRQY